MSEQVLHVRKPGWFTVNVLNRSVAWLTRRGFSVWGSRVLAVRGRKSGEWRRTPVNLLTLGDERYLVAPRGHVLKLGESGFNFRSLFYVYVPLQLASVVWATATASGASWPKTIQRLRRTTRKPGHATSTTRSGKHRSRSKPSGAYAARTTSC